MSKPRAIDIAILAAALGLSSSADAAEDPLRRLIGSKAGSSICFSRTYDAGHLRRNPGQSTTSVLLSLRYDVDDAPTVRIAIKQKDKSARYVVGACEWSEGVNRSVDGTRLIKAFTKDTGFQCMAIMQHGSAEEGGDVPLDLHPDGSTLTLYLDQSIGAFASLDTHRVATRIRLSRDDRIFRLNRVNEAECRAMERGL
jgi:hypothetical protein